MNTSHSLGSFCKRAGLAALVAPLFLCASVNASAAPAVKLITQGFSAPTGIAIAKDGTFYVADWSANTVTHVNAKNERTVIARGIPGAAGIVLDDKGTLYVSSYNSNDITRIDASGKSERIASGLSTPTGMSFAKDGRLLIANRSSGEVVALNLATRKINTLASGFSLPVGVVEMDDGSLVVPQYGGRLTHVLADGKQRELGKDFSRPGVGIAVLDSNTVWATDNGAGAIRSVTLEGKSALIAENMEGSVVAAALSPDKRTFLIGTWAGNIYRLIRQ